MFFSSPFGPVLASSYRARAHLQSPQNHRNIFHARGTVRNIAFNPRKHRMRRYCDSQVIKPGRGMVRNYAFVRISNDPVVTSGHPYESQPGRGTVRNHAFLQVLHDHVMTSGYRYESQPGRGTVRNHAFIPVLSCYIVISVHRYESQPSRGTVRNHAFMPIFEYHVLTSSLFMTAPLGTERCGTERLCQFLHTMCSNPATDMKASLAAERCGTTRLSSFCINSRPSASAERVFRFLARHRGLIC